MGYFRFEGEGVTVELLETNFGSTFQVPLNEDYELPNGTYDITIIAQEGYTIESVSYIDPDWQSEMFFTITEDGKKATKTGVYVSNWTNIVFTIVTTGSNGGNGGDDETSFKGFTNVYLVDETILKSIADEGLIRTWGEPASVIRVDLRDYIINVLELPFSIPDDVIGDEAPIKLGEYELETVAKEIKQNLLFLDLGNITVPAKYGNSFDFMDTTVKLYLPFIDTITLEPEYVINQEMNIKYIIDLFSGNCTVNILSSKTDRIIYSDNHRLGRNIPFYSKNNVVNNLSDMNGIYNEVLTPYVEVVRNRVSSLNTFNNRVDVEGILLNEKGFIIVNEIDLKTNASYEEKIRIKQLLSDGVIIK